MGIFPIYYSVMSRSVAQPSPAKAPGATTLPSTESILRALRVLICPLVKLALRSGVKYAELDELIRDSLVAEAKLQCGDRDQRNGSKLSIMTGLHRKEIAARMTNLDRASNVESLAKPKPPLARQVFEKWAHEARKNSTRRSLSIASNNARSYSFSRLVREIVSDVHPRTVLDELVRLGVVIEHDTTVELKQMNFVSSTSADSRLELLATNAGAMIRTSVENVIASRPAQLEQAIGGSGISLSDAIAISELANTHWQKTRAAIYEALVAAPEVVEPNVDKYRIRIGAYTNYEALASETNIASQVPLLERK
jgi:hypothetical protein